MVKKKPGPSGSEKRERAHIIAVRVNGLERAELNLRATRAGISIPAYIRHQALDVPLPRQRNRPAVEMVVLARLLGQVGKIGSNLNQIAKRANMSAYVDELDIGFLEQLNSELAIWGDALMKAMGREL